MGIKKRLEQKPEGPGRLDEVVVEEPNEKKKGIIFDVETEIGEEGWEKIKAFYDSKRDKGRLSILAERLKIIFPDKIDRLDLDGIWEKLKALYGDNESLVINISSATTIKILFPERVSELDLESKWLAFKEDFKGSSINKVGLGIYIKQASELKILFPNHIDELDLESKWEDIKEGYEKLKQEKRWLLVSNQLARFKMLFPEKMEELNWQENLGQMINNFRFDFGDNEGLKNANLAILMARNLKIIAAKEIKITDQGMELVMPEKEEFEDKVPDRPERLKRE